MFFIQKKVSIIAVLVVLQIQLSAQNVGINNNSPRFPLSFNKNIGDKITLWDNYNVDSIHYGIGLQSKLLQFHTDLPSSDIVMGYGSSAALTEKFRFKGNGFLGINTNTPQFYVDVNGQIRLRHSGIYNTAIEYYNGAGPKMGMVDDNIWSIYASGSDYTRMYMNNTTGNFSVGAVPSDYPLLLGFPYDPVQDYTAGGSILLYEDPNLGNQFRISADKYSLYLSAQGTNTDLTVGYDQYNTGFNERFAVKQSGALAFSGNTGTVGKYLRSNGSAAPVDWYSFSNTNYGPEQIVCSGPVSVANNNTSTVAIPGLTKTFTLAAPAKVRINYNVTVESPSCVFCGIAFFELIIDHGTGFNDMIVRDQIENGRSKDMIGSFLLDADAGTTNLNIYMRRISGPALKFGYVPDYIKENYMIFEIAD